MITCPLCRSTAISELERIGISDLVHIYRQTLQIDVSQLFHDKQFTYYLCSICDLRFFNPCITGDEQFYNSLQKYDWYYMDEKPEYDIAAPFIRSSDRVLEIGSGKGAFAKYIRAHEYLGLEFSQSAQRLAQESGVSVIGESIENHALLYPAHYDVVCSFQVLEHVADVSGFLNAAIRCLKPGGLLILAVPSYDSFLRFAVNGALNMPPHHVTHWSHQALQFIGAHWGLSLVQLRHEQVAEYHQAWYLETLFMRLLRRKFGLRDALIDLSWTSRTLARAAKFGTRIFRQYLSVELLPNGHTVSIVLRKI